MTMDRQLVNGDRHNSSMDTRTVTDVQMSLTDRKKTDRQLTTSRWDRNKPASGPSTCTDGHILKINGLTDVRAHTHTHTDAHACTHIHARARTHTRARTNTRTQTYAHTRTHTHMKTYTQETNKTMNLALESHPIK